MHEIQHCGALLHQQRSPGCLAIKGRRTEFITSQQGSTGVTVTLHLIQREKLGVRPIAAPIAAVALKNLQFRG